MRFALPPSRGNRFQSAGDRLLELFLEQPLAPEYRATVHVCPDYARLSQEVLSGQSLLAWAPPLLCARVERAGGAVVARFERKGLTRYRSAFVCAKDRPLDLKTMRSVRAVWIDADSTAGYLLPRVHLSRVGVDPAQAFRSESFAKSYAAALELVAQGLADLTAVYASPAAASAAHTGLDDVPLPVRERLQIAGYTEEAPNDALIIAPGLAVAERNVLQPRLLSALRNPSAAYMLGQVFNADAVEPAAPGSYDALLRLTSTSR
jgi:phosphonate transport system substrate-binding protein